MHWSQVFLALTYRYLECVFLMSLETIISPYIFVCVGEHIGEFASHVGIVTEMKEEFLDKGISME